MSCACSAQALSKAFLLERAELHFKRAERSRKARLRSYSDEFGWRLLFMAFDGRD